MSGVKTFSNETSERYALALFELAKENSELDNIEKQVSLLLKTCEKNDIFANFLKDPTNKPKVQKQVFTEISKIMSFNKILINFLNLIIEKRRIYFLDRILDKFINLSSKKRGKIVAELISSKNLTDAEREKINLEISKSIKSNIDFTYKTDKSLISGIKLQLGSLLIDTSLRSKLKKLKHIMVNN